MIPDLSELMALHNDSEETFAGEVLWQIAALIPRRGLDALLSELPPEWRRALITWLVEAYDNECPADDFIHINNPGGREQILHARTWMKNNSTYRDEVINDVPTLLAMLENRIFGREDLIRQLIRLSASQGAAAIVHQLPDVLSKKFVDWCRAHLLPADAPLCSPGEREIRDWILTHEGTKCD